LQNGFLDEQAKFSKGRLTFLTQQTFSSLSKTILDESSSAGINSIPSMKDNLEVYRLLAYTESKDKKNQDNPFSRVCYDLTKNDLKSGVENGVVRTEKMQLYLWICHLFAILGNNDEMIRSWDCLADFLHSDILCLHALQVLRMYSASDPSLNSDIYDKNSIASLRSFYLNFWRGDKGEVNKMKISTYHWKCKLCSKPEKFESSDDSYTDCFNCTENNHKWPRCVLTLKICDEPTLLKCRWCESVALKFLLLDYTNVYCSICSGPFI